MAVVKKALLSKQPLVKATETAFLALSASLLSSANSASISIYIGISSSASVFNNLSIAIVRKGLSTSIGLEREVEKRAAKANRRERGDLSRLFSDKF